MLFSLGLEVYWLFATVFPINEPRGDVVPKSYFQIKGKRPVLDIPYSQLEIMAELVAGIGILFTVIMLVITWPQIPNTVPTHFGASGIADSWGSKMSLLLLPTIVIFLYVMLTVVSRFPHTFNYPSDYNRGKC